MGRYDQDQTERRRAKRRRKREPERFDELRVEAKQSAPANDDAPPPHVERIGAYFDEFHKNGDGYVALCSAHDDRNPSLSIKAGKDGHVLLHCFAGCDTADVLKAVGLTFDDLRPHTCDIAPLRNATVYPYHDEQGVLVYEIVRLPGKAMPARKPNGEWGIEGIRRVLYRLPELLAADPAEPVFICEGEKDSDRLGSLGLVATTPVFGQWLDSYSNSLAGRKAILLPDNDPPGRKKVEKIFDKLGNKPASRLILPLPGLPEKGDVSDWIEAGGTRDQLLALVEGAPDPDAPLTFDEIETLVGDIEYLVPDWVPKGMLTMLLASPSGGKSVFAMGALAGPLLTGEPFFNGQRPDPGNVLWVDCEYHAAITRMLLKSFDLPKSRYQQPRFPGDDPLRAAVLTSDDDLTLIERTIRRDAIGLVVVDSIRGGHLRDENSSLMQSVYQSLSGIAQRTGVAIVVIHHAKKLQPGEELTIEHARGSNSQIAQCRAVLGMDIPDPSSDWRRVRMLKQNLCIAPEPLGVLLTETSLEFGPAPSLVVRTRAPKQKSAEALILEFLGKGPKTAKVLERLVVERNVKRETFENARKDLANAGRIEKRILRAKGKNSTEWYRPEVEA